MICNHCGAEIENDSMFCSECGQKCEEVVADAAAIQETGAAEAESAAEVQEAGAAEADVAEVQEAGAIEVENVTDAAEVQEAGATEAENVTNTVEVQSVEASETESVTKVQSNGTPKTEMLAAYTGTAQSGAEGQVSMQSSYEAPAMPENNVYTAPVSPEQAAPVKKKGKAVKVVAAVAVGAIVIGGVAVGATKLLPMLQGEKETPEKAIEHVIYAQDGDAYFADKNLKNTVLLDEFDHEYDVNSMNYSMGIQLVMESPSNVLYRITEDGKYLYYMDSDAEGRGFYYKNLKKEKEDSVRIDKDVANFALYSNGMVGYRTTKGEWYLGKLDEFEEVADDVDSVSYISEEDAYWITTYNNDSTRNLSIYYYKEDKLEEVVEDVDDIKNWQMTTAFAYTEGDTTYAVRDLEEEEELGEDIRYFHGGWNDWYYIVDDEDEFHLIDFMKNDMPTRGELKEPVIEDFQTTETVTSWGNTYEQTVTDYDAYYEACDEYWEEYNEVCDQENYLSMLENYSVDGFHKGTMYHYEVKSGEITEVMTGLFADTWNGSFLYCEEDNIAKVRFSDLMEKMEDYSFDYYKWIKDQVYAEMKFYIYTDKGVHFVDADTEDYSSINVLRQNENKALIEMIQKTDEDMGIQCYTLATLDLKKEDGKPATIDDDVHKVYSEYIKDDFTNLYYVKDYDSEKAEGDLYCDGEKLYKNVYNLIAVDGKDVFYVTDYESHQGTLYRNDEKLAKKVYLGKTYLREGNKFYYMSNYDRDNNTGILIADFYYFNGKESEKILKDVVEIAFLDKSHIIVLSDMNKKAEGLLQIYDGKKFKDIAEDVNYFMLSY